MEAHMWLGTLLIALSVAGAGDKAAAQPATTQPVAPPRTTTEILRMYDDHYPLNLPAAATQPASTNRTTVGQANPPTAALPVTQPPLPALPVTRPPLPAQPGQPLAQTPIAQRQRYAQAATQPWRPADNNPCWQSQIDQRPYFDPRLDPRIDQSRYFNQTPDVRDLSDPRLNAELGVRRMSDPRMNPSLDTRKQKELDAQRFGPRVIRGDNSTNSGR